MASLFGQLKTLLWRNALLKKRNRKQVFQELFFPIYFVLILSLIKTFAKPSTTPPTPEFPQYSLADPRFVLNTNRTILVAPNTTEVKDIIASVQSYIGSLNVVYSATEAEAVALYKASSANVSAGIVFNNTGDNPVYSIRTTYDDDLLSTMVFTGKGECLKAEQSASDSNCKANKYLTSGFAWLQHAIEAAFIKRKNASFPLPEVYIQMMPKDEFTSDISYIQTLSSVYFVMAYSFFVNFLTVNIVAEKEKKIREGMKMMGLKDSVFWLSWGLTYTLLITVVTAIITVIAYGFQFFGRSSNLFIFFLLMLLYGISIINLAFAVTPFFRKAQVAGMVTSFATIAISCLYFAVSMTRDITRDGYHYNFAPGGIWALCLLSPVALALGIDQGIYLDTAKGGMTFANMSVGEFPLSGPLIMLVVDIILYALIAVYLDHVIPGEYGPRYSPWYFLMPSYYCRKTSKDPELSTLTNNDHSANGINTSASPDIEPVHQDLKDKAGVRIFNICKDFQSKDETIHAVRGLSLDMYEGHITALLGHNGAGKTTLINMLCGLTPPTSGTATIYGLDVSVSGDMERIRSMCGVCPQHNILYDDLTTKEHLIVFAGIKGVAENIKEAAVTRAMKDADIYDKADTFAKNLSGGQKRKLSVAMALIGDPKIIFLDEPTAGMDPFSRRHLWSLLQSSKKGRIILLTTHFMDEADILADRKAIVNHGSLRCLGSSLFLKNRFGIGYHLNMVVEPDCDTERVTSVLSEQVKGVQVKRSHAKELAFTLPLSEVSTFSNMFSSLEQKVDGTTQAEKLGIKSYGVSMTTLEEVFLKLGEDTDDANDTVQGFGNPNYDSFNPNSNQRVYADSQSQVNIELKDHINPTLSAANVPTVENLTSQRFRALLKLRFLIIIRNPLSVIFQIILPIVFVVVGCILSTLGKTTEDGSNPTPVSLFATSAAYTAGPLAVIDSQGNADSTAFISKTNETWRVDENLNTSLLLFPNHILGFNLQLYQQSSNDINYTALYNTTAVHSLPSIINIMSNTMYSLISGGFNISGSSLLWPSLSTKLKYNGSAFSATMILALAFAVLSPGFAVFLVMERQNKTRGQQRVAGINFNMYWGSLFVINCCVFAIPVIICIIIVGAVPVESLNSAGAMVALVLLFITYIPANILVVYNFSFAFNAYETCQAVLPNVMIFSVILPYIAVSLVDMLGYPDAATAIHCVMAVINPLYSLIGGLYYIDRIHRVSLITRTVAEFGSYFKGENNILIAILMPIVHCLLLYLLLRVLDVRSTGGKAKEAVNCFQKSRVNDIPEENQDLIVDEDEDVAEERSRVNSLQTGAQDAPVAYVQNLRKEFSKDIKAFCQKTKQKTNVAVRNATFAVDSGEVFGLLGPNGAGKTTTLNMVIAETGPTRGKVMVAGNNVRSSMSSAFQAMGYCAQHDALWDNITVHEHLEFYGMIRGLKQEDSVSMADNLIESLKVQEHAKKGAKKLSGGTKRKLSYAISMLGSPEIVLLDEPSTGMDPQSKRFLWDTISSSFQGTKRGAILTTHYMEEADALCSRVAIMVNGRMECLGPTQHLKDKYGSGYLLEVKLKTGDHEQDVEARMDSLERHLVSLFPQASSLERFEERGQYKIPKDDVKSLAETFSSLEQTKHTHDVEEYSFSQSTLEQVFLDFAKKQVEEGQEEDDIPKSLNRQLSAGGVERGSINPGYQDINVRM